MSLSEVIESRPELDFVNSITEELAKLLELLKEARSESDRRKNTSAAEAFNAVIEFMDGYDTPLKDFRRFQEIKD